MIYEWRGRFVLLRYEWFPIQTPNASIDLVWIDEEKLATFKPREPTKTSKKK